MAELTLQDDFKVEPYHAILSSYSVVTPVATLPNGNIVSFGEVDAGEGEPVTQETFEMPAMAVQSYTGDNMVPVSSLSPQGIEDYQRGAVVAAIHAMGPDVVADFLPEMDIVDAQRITAGNIDADQANDFLRDGLVDTFEAFKLEANNPVDGGVMDMNDPEHAAVFDNLDRIGQQLSVAIRLPGYTNSLETTLEADMSSAEPQMPIDQLDTAIRVIGGAELAANTVDFNPMPAGQ